MCSPANFSSPVHIDACSSDEVLLVQLYRLMHGDPLPDNVITEISPFKVTPSASPDDVLYLHRDEEGRTPPKLELEFKAIEGYWKAIGHDHLIGTPTVGRKTTWEFLKGPFGDKTGWMMCEYQIEQKELDTNSKARNFSSLSRIFFNNSQQQDHGEQKDLVDENDVEGFYIDSFLNLLDTEEDNHSLSTHATQVINGRDELKSTGDSEGMHSSKSRLDDATEDTNKIDCFLNEDYMEFNDLNSSSSSDDSSRMSVTSDDFFDPDALLRDIESEANPDTEGQNMHCRFNISASLRSDQVIIKPPPSGLLKWSRSNLRVRERVEIDAMEGQKIASNITIYKCAENPPPNHEEASSSSADARGGVMANQSNHSLSASTSQGRRRPVRRISKLQKYCCFFPF
ncbi:hypothetical protein QJS10_CPA02g00421 [Acorus calamus]|uniref:NAC domain-containing protein n=1 Tax=Acorus calamus TaxID=4465 RepID=A0AAV9FAL1_ACOCL|nr:hypothetical protein QJS10_CPA02g00421 [Acorus calamus]